jgi:hypothetical protein
MRQAPASGTYFTTTRTALGCSRHARDDVGLVGSSFSRGLCFEKPTLRGIKELLIEEFVQVVCAFLPNFGGLFQYITVDYVRLIGCSSVILVSVLFRHQLCFRFPLLKQAYKRW